MTTSTKNIDSSGFETKRTHLSVQERNHVKFALNNYVENRLFIFTNLVLKFLSHYRTTPRICFSSGSIEGF